jgi:hypothetical protein
MSERRDRRLIEVSVSISTRSNSSANDGWFLPDDILCYPSFAGALAPSSSAIVAESEWWQNATIQKALFAVNLSIV